MSSTLNKGDIQLQISQFILQLKRQELTGSHDVALATAHLLLRFVSASKWSHLDQLIADVRTLGKRLEDAHPREFACGNIVRRVLALIREASGAEAEGGLAASSMFELLSDKLPAAESKTKKGLKDAKAEIIEGIQELIEEISTSEENISTASADMIHEDEVILTATPDSKTVLAFLLKASIKRKFTVLITESFPNATEGAHAFARKLAKAGIETVIIPDSLVYAAMSRVGKVLIGARTVLTDGSCISSAGVAAVCECAQQYRTPVLALAGAYKLSPRHPFDIESLIEVGDSGKVVSFTDNAIVDNVEVINPVYDYIRPKNIDICITNLGGFSSSFVYRLVLDHYNPLDVDLSN
jgi:translation initiation factor eIF-2B subunit beta